MKRTIGIIGIITVLLLLPLMASAEYSDQLLWQEIPWGVSFDFVNTLLDVSKGTPEFPQSVDAICYYDNSKGIPFTYKGLTVTAFSNYPSDKGIRVGGHFVDTWALYFAYIPQNGRITYNSSDTSLYAARYTIDPEDQYKTSQEDLVSDYTSKLTLLYGDPDANEAVKITSGDKTYQMKAVHWYGADQTEIVLSYFVNRDYYDEVYITYAYRGGDALLQAADAAVDPNSLAYKRLYCGCGGL